MNIDESVLKQVERCMFPSVSRVDEMKLGSDVTYNVKLEFEATDAYEPEKKPDDDFLAISVNDLKNRLEPYVGAEAAQEIGGAVIRREETTGWIGDLKTTCEHGGYRITVTVARIVKFAGDNNHSVMRPFSVVGPVVAFDRSDGGDGHGYVVKFSIKAPSDFFNGEVDEFRRLFGSKFYSMTTNVDYDFGVIDVTDVKVVGKEMTGVVTVSGITLDQAEKYRSLPWAAFRRMDVKRSEAEE